jgi:hypothetical protein
MLALGWVDHHNAPAIIRSSALIRSVAKAVALIHRPRMLTAG